MHEEQTGPARRRPWSTAAVVAGYLGAWLVLAALAAVLLFLGSDREVNLASHDAVVRPDLTGEVVVRTGPVLPDVRVASDSRIGIDVRLGKTDATTTGALLDRYAVIAAQPEGLEAKLREAVEDMAVDAALRGAVLGLVPLLVWVLVGGARRRELLGVARTPRGLLAVALVGLMAAGLWQPWAPREDRLTDEQRWIALDDFLGPGVPVPEELADVEVLGDVTTDETSRLVASAVDTYDKSRVFYADAAQAAADLDLHEPAEGGTVAVVVSDRHDNVGMDAVARGIGDAAGASAVLDLGDDTSTGQPWEAFSLDSLNAAFDGDPYDDRRWAVTGNHDNGDFVGRYLADRGWTLLDGEVVDGPGGGDLLGVSDPRASGLGSWRDETGLSFDEVGTRLADAACGAEDRVETVVVHDANMAREVLERGCADLVLGGHLHVQGGPDRVEATDGDQVGYTVTNGTTGGAAYALAIGSKIRRAADVTLVTYAEDGRPAGVQSVQLQTNGAFTVRDYVELELAEAG
ncbi:metallophosphoesterase [Nocardioides kribbensis]|uniref:metallophosphoesterase n=1 Tax=Nocardioides kribbensis TaxID=305517 RepID=UPI0032DABC97